MSDYLQMSIDELKVQRDRLDETIAGLEEFRGGRPPAIPAPAARVSAKPKPKKSNAKPKRKAATSASGKKCSSCGERKRIKALGKCAGCYGRELAEKQAATDADVLEVKQQIRMGGAKTAFVETMMEQGGSAGARLINGSARKGMVDAGVLEVTEDGITATLTELGVRWAASCGIGAS